jgi:hypothetical protein
MVDLSTVIGVAGLLTVGISAMLGASTGTGLSS